MAFRVKELGVLAYARGVTYWYYRTEDGTDAVTGKGYFADAAGMLRLGDRITTATSDQRALDLVVTRNDARGVVVEALSASPAMQSA